MIEKSVVNAEKCKKKHEEIINADWALMLVWTHKLSFWDLNEKEKKHVLSNLTVYKDIG